jgi:hypothetical protein
MFLLQARRPQVYRPQPAAARPASRAPAKDPYAHIPADLGEQLSEAMARWKPAPATPPRPPAVPAPAAGNCPPPPPPAPPPLPPYVLEGRQPTSAEVMQYMDLSGLRLPYNKPRQEPPPRDDDDDPPLPPPSPWQPYAAQGGVWADEDDEEEYYDEWTNGPRERTALDDGTTAAPQRQQEEPGSVALRAETSRDAPILQTTNEYLPRLRGRWPKAGWGQATHAMLRCAAFPHPALRATFPPLRAGKVLEGDAGEERMKSGLGQTLIRICRAGVAAVAGPCVRTCLDVVSRLSHHAHPMPILRAFRRDDRVSPAALLRHICLTSGLRPLPHGNAPMRLLSSRLSGMPAA